MNVHLDDRGRALYDIFDTLPGQINFSILYPGIVKAWHRHKLQTDYFCVVTGNARIALFDEIIGIFHTHFTGEHNPKIVIAHPGIWHGYTPIGDTPCGLLYYTTEKYNPEEPDEERTSWDSFGYDWSVENK